MGVKISAAGYGKVYHPSVLGEQFGGRELRALTHASILYRMMQNFDISSPELTSLLNSFLKRVVAANRTASEAVSAEECEDNLTDDNYISGKVSALRALTHCSDAIVTAATTTGSELMSSTYFSAVVDALETLLETALPVIPRYSTNSIRQYATICEPSPAQKPIQFIAGLPVELPVIAEVSGVDLTDSAALLAIRVQIVYPDGRTDYTCPPLSHYVQLGPRLLRLSTVVHLSNRNSAETFDVHLSVVRRFQLDVDCDCLLGTDPFDFMYRMEKIPDIGIGIERLSHAVAVAIKPTNPSCCGGFL